MFRIFCLILLAISIATSRPLFADDDLVPPGRQQNLDDSEARRSPDGTRTPRRGLARSQEKSQTDNDDASEAQANPRQRPPGTRQKNNADPKANDGSNQTRSNQGPANRNNAKAKRPHADEKEGTKRPQAEKRIIPMAYYTLARRSIKATGDKVSEEARAVAIMKAISEFLEFRRNEFDDPKAKIPEKVQKEIDAAAVAFVRKLGKFGLLQDKHLLPSPDKEVNLEFLLQAICMKGAFGAVKDKALLKALGGEKDQMKKDGSLSPLGTWSKIGSPADPGETNSEDLNDRENGKKGKDQRRDKELFGLVRPRTPKNILLPTLILPKRLGAAVPLNQTKNQITND